MKPLSFLSRWLEPDELPALPPGLRRLYTERWSNGAMIEVLFYEQPIQGEDPSDRLHLLVTAGGQPPVRRGWLLNAEDALGIIRGLTLGVQAAIEAGAALRPGGAPALNTETPAGLEGQETRL